MNLARTCANVAPAAVLSRLAMPLRGEGTGRQENIFAIHPFAKSAKGLIGYTRMQGSVFNTLNRRLS